MNQISTAPNGALKEYKSLDNIPNLASDIKVEEFFNVINLNIAANVLSAKDFIIFINKLKKVVQIAIEDNKEKYNEVLVQLGEDLKRNGEQEFLGLQIKYGTNQNWVDHSLTGDEELIKLREIKKEVEERIAARETYWKVTAETVALQKPPFGINSPKHFIHAHIPVLRLIKKEIEVTTPPLQKRQGVKFII